MLGNGDKVYYTGPAQMDPKNLPQVVEIQISHTGKLPPGATWDYLLPVPEVPDEEETNDKTKG